MGRMDDAWILSWRSLRSLRSSTYVLFALLMERDGKERAKDREDRMTGTEGDGRLLSLLPSLPFSFEKKTKEKRKGRKKEKAIESFLFLHPSPEIHKKREGKRSDGISGG